MFIETSQDLLLVIIAFCVLGLTIFLCWTIYYLTQILRQINSVAKRAAGVFEKLDALIDYVREKLDKSSSYFAILLTGVKQVIDYISEKKEEKTSKKSKKRK